MAFALRPMLASDASWIHDACQDAEIQRWTTVPRPYTLAHAREFVRFAATADVWVIEADGRGAGVISVHALDPASREATVGYWVAPDERGRGVATWALRELARILRQRPDVSTLAAVIADSNLASQRAARAADLVRTTDRDQAHDGDDHAAPATRWRLALS